MPHEMTRQNLPPDPGAGFGAGLTNATDATERPSSEAASGTVPIAEAGSAATSPVAAAGRATHAATVLVQGPRRAGQVDGASGAPSQPWLELDALWIQVAGTLCNLACTHCFVTCGPDQERHAMMSRTDVAARVAEALTAGVREIYLTGGEPFLHPDLEVIVEDTLAVAPVTVLTNGTLFTERRVRWLAALTRSARHSLELRVSLDATEEGAHDAFRGAGAWARTIAGLRALEAQGLVPIVTFTRPLGVDEAVLAAAAVAALRAEGVSGTRLKLLPMFALGRELTRLGEAPAPRSLAGLPAEAFDPARLQCGRSRAVTSRGVFVCPLLVDEPGGRMGDTLHEAARPFALVHDACVTCWATGMSCAND
jgi:pyruvate-formate lyase-activating enzyme